MHVFTIDALGELFDGPHATPTRRESGPYFLNISSLVNGRLDLAESDHVSEDDFSRWTRRVTPRHGDLLFSYETRLGSAAMMPSGVQACLGRRMALLRPNPDRVDQRYLLYRYLAPDFQALISEKAIHGATVDRIALSSMGAWRIGIHERREQRAIAEVLGALDDKIAANDHVAQVSEQLLRAKFDVLGMMSPYELNAALADVIEFNPRRLAAGLSPFVDMQSLPTIGWSIAEPACREVKGGARFTNGDTLLARITPCLENRKTGFVDDLAPGEVGVGSTEFVVMRSRQGTPLPLSFFVATHDEFRSHAIQHMVGTSGRQRVAAQDLATFRIALPDDQALEAWGDLANGLFARVKLLSVESRRLARLRDALLPELMSGRVRVKDAVREVEAVL